MVFVIEGKLLTGEPRQRHGIFPAFFDKVEGHDYGLYGEILAQIRYFGIEPLETGVEKKRYYAAIKAVYAPFLGYSLLD